MIVPDTDTLWVSGFLWQDHLYLPWAVDFVELCHF